MKYLVWAALLVLCAALLSSLCGCVRTNTENEIKNNKLYLKDGPGSYPVREIEYDGCQYLAIGSGNTLTVTHKGNCKYCLERNKGKQ